MNTVVDNSKYILKLCIREMMEKRGINRHQLCKLIGVKYDTIHRYYIGDCYQIDLDIIARICSVLDCKISDVLILEEKELQKN